MFSETHMPVLASSCTRKLATCAGGLLENVTGVIGVLLSLLSGWLFHDFPEMQWKDFAMKEWKKQLKTLL